MDNHPFCFDGYEVSADRLNLSFSYSMTARGREWHFTERITLPQPFPADIPGKLLTVIMQSLHLMLGISYWKIACPSTIVINGYALTLEQAQFWNTVYTKGLGEFFYRNSIDFNGLVNFPAAGTVKPTATSVAVAERSLLGIAGGKDSLLSARLMADGGFPYTAVVFETGNVYPVIDEVLSQLSVQALKIRRIIDPQLYELNTQGVYNGHIPISAVYAFLGVAAACFYGYRAMVVSNERSANYGNVVYRGMEINHQWSKSIEFETLFSRYIAEFVTPSVSYFSLLRSLNELQIVKQFVKYPEYLTHFTSCNRNFKAHGQIQDRKWCGECPKCAFVFSLLAAYLPRQKTVDIFGKDLYADESLLPTYRQLLGISDFKPFECVGTPEEVKTAFALARKKNEFAGSAAMAMFEREVERWDTSGAETGTGDISQLPVQYRKLVEKL